MKRTTIESLWPVLTAVLLHAAPSGFAARPPSRLYGKLEEDPLCTAAWNFTPCVPVNNMCGAGYRLGVRSGELCRVLTQLFACTAPCIESDGAVHVEALFDRSKRDPNKEGKKRENPGGRPQPAAQKHFSPAPAAATGVEPAVDYRAHKEGSLYTQDGCTYSVGGWQGCSVVILSKQREDVLLAKVNDATRCSEKKTVTMDCSLKEISGKSGALNHTGHCRYSYGTWSECEARTNTRVRRQVLLSGHADCLPEVNVRKPCYDKSGRERCFYGRWSQWSACVDNVKTRRREIFHGGERCLNLSVREAFCSTAS